MKDFKVNYNFYHHFDKYLNSMILKLSLSSNPNNLDISHTVLKKLKLYNFKTLPDKARSLIDSKHSQIWKALISNPTVSLKYFFKPNYDDFWFEKGISLSESIVHKYYKRLFIKQYLKQKRYKLSIGIVKGLYSYSPYRKRINSYAYLFRYLFNNSGYLNSWDLEKILKKYPITAIKIVKFITKYIPAKYIDPNRLITLYKKLNLNTDNLIKSIYFKKSILKYINGGVPLESLSKLINIFPKYLIKQFIKKWCTIKDEYEVNTKQLLLKCLE